MSDDPTYPAFWLAVLALAGQATGDYLTGLYNRRYFEATLEDHLAAAGRYDRELSLVLFDIDDFKRINDTHGHAAGDRVLQEFARLLKASARRADILCRHGGDEFAVILPETGESAAREFAERICRLQQKHNESGSIPSFHVSAGVAALPCSSLVDQADMELLAIKKACRQ